MKTPVPSSPRFASLLLGGLLLVGCSGAPNLSTEGSANFSTESAAQAPVSEADLANVAEGEISESSPATPADVPQAQPQLAKTENLTLILPTVEDGIAAVNTLVREQRGDVLELQDYIPQDGYPQSNDGRHTASMRVRVPQAQLDPTLAALAELGDVQSQSITAEDVSNQLVDVKARLRNLRRTEEMLLGIMERSGSVAEVLEVAREVDGVRASIEQIDAQLKQLQNRVAYSTVYIELSEAGTLAPLQRPLGERLHETWKTATRSVSELTVNFTKLGLWLIAYSPYLLILVGVGYGVLRLRKGVVKAKAIKADSSASGSA